MIRSLSLLSFSLFCLPFALSADFESVTISANLDNVAHTCISKCLYYTVLSDMGSAMGCDDPYDNNCYCATASASASVADAFMSKCATSLCSAGDRSRDLTSMQSYYASYCMGAGFTQPGATGWYNPAEATEEPSPESSDSSSESSDRDSDAQPSRTANSEVDETSTQLTIVTQTTEGGSGPTRSGGTVPASTTILRTSAVLTVCLLVIVQATSTYWVNPDGSPSSALNDNSTTKIGVGVAVPVAVFVIVGILSWWIVRRRRQQKAQFPLSIQPLSEVTTGGSPPIVPVPAPTPEKREGLNRKPVGASTVSPVSSVSQTNELSGVGVQREIAGREIHPFPDTIPGPPLVVAGQHEMSGQGWRPNLEMDGRDARVEMSGEARPPELPGQGSPPPVYMRHENTQRWELPDNSR
ncbi:hypothetical protein F66182_8865 [Fusarium sp. NRRL 66182]|nr:hypothetical protein F66182_8865 [Fusarium sp. NRRL 66182]